MCDKVHGTGRAASTTAQLDRRLGFFTKIQCGSTLRKCHQGHGVRFMQSPGTLFWVLVRKTGLTTWRSKTGWSLQPLKCLYLFTQIAKWWQWLVMLTNSRCLRWIIKMLEQSCSVITSDPAAYDSTAWSELGWDPSRQVSQLSSSKQLILADSQSHYLLLHDSAWLGKPLSWSLCASQRSWVFFLLFTNSDEFSFSCLQIVG